MYHLNLSYSLSIYEKRLLILQLKQYYQKY